MAARLFLDRASTARLRWYMMTFWEGGENALPAGNPHSRNALAAYSLSPSRSSSRTNSCSFCSDADHSSPSLSITGQKFQRRMIFPDIRGTQVLARQ